ncbi:MAG: nucleoside-diphosphate kinase [Bacteroidales bacterium]|nr:nucleoside-diphosphate kinase [Bacteroidales bacterium]MBN2756249.1 nucleoside-diphosphate kinase [Bacteroidales bacterium]
MSGNRTFTMIKPVAVKNGHIGHILNKITDAGFRIVAMKMTKLCVTRAKAFYGVHNDKPFFEDLVKFMTSGPIVAAILEKENAVEDYRKLIGATNPEKAEEGTIRKEFAISMQENAVHGSDSDENAEMESNFFFSFDERYNQDGFEELG